MIYRDSYELVILLTPGGKASLYEPHAVRGIESTEANIQRWRQWIHVINESEHNQALKLAIEQAELIYELSRDG